MSNEFDPVQHEVFVSERLQKLHQQAARVALFEELFAFVDTGDCTQEQAIEQYKHDAAESGLL